MDVGRKDIRLLRRERLLTRSQLGTWIGLIVIGLVAALIFSLGGGEAIGGGSQTFINGQPPGPDQLAGQQLYEQYCFGCHGLTGDGNPDAGIPPLNQYGTAWTRTRAELEAHILDGGKTMPELKGLVSPTDAGLLIDFIELWWTAEQVDTYNQINN